LQLAVTLYISTCSFDATSLGLQGTFEKRSHTSDGLETGLQDAFGRRGDGSRLLNVIVHSSTSTAGTGLGVALAGYENGQEGQSLVDAASAIDLRIGDDDAITGRGDENTKLLLEKPTATTRPRNRTALWTKFRRLSPFATNHLTSGFATETDKTLSEKLGNSRW
jgi:hypothetical protein